MEKMRARSGRGKINRMKNPRAAFTLVEMLTVMVIIAILAGLVLSTAGYAQKKAAMSRAEAEIAAMSAACESYKADNGIYPRDGNTDNLNARTSGNPSGYAAASKFLYMELSGDKDATGTPDTTTPKPPRYMAFKKDKTFVIFSQKDAFPALVAQ